MFVTRSYDTFEKKELNYITPADMGDKEYPGELVFRDRDGNLAVARLFDDGSWRVWWDQDIFDDFTSATALLVLPNRVITSLIEKEVRYVSTAFKRFRALDGSIMQTYFETLQDGQGFWMVWN